MKSKLATSFMLMAASTVAFAAGGHEGHEPSIKDLLYPTINFVLYAGGAIYLLRPILKNLFDKQADDVVSLMNSAEERSKDAKTKLATAEKKMQALDSEVTRIKSEYKNFLENFKVNASAETKSHIERTAKDNLSKIEGEKKALIEELNEELLTSVIAKTKTTINGNANLKANATKNIVSELR